MRRLVVLITLLFILVALLTSCDNKHDEFDHFFTHDERPSEDSSGNAPQNNSVAIGHTGVDSINGLEGTLNLLLCEYGDYIIEDLLPIFGELNPRVNINIEFYDAPRDTASQLALTTRLLADPPDIFMFSSDLNFEKISMDTLFVDHYELFNGPRGISLDDYFSNIYRATELHGGLYCIPLSADVMLAIPNIRLFEGIGVDPYSIPSVSIDDEIDFYTRISGAFPDESLYPTTRFSIWRALTRNPVYNIDTGVVNVNTPEMVRRLNMAMDIPINNDYVRFRPESITVHYISSTGIAGSLLEQSDLIFLDSEDNTNWSFSVLFLQEHPDIQFAAPVPFSYGNKDNIAFQSTYNFSIMKASANTDLAWEFIRFMMEYEEPRYAGISSTFPYDILPINRNAFDNQVNTLLEFIFEHAMYFTDMEKYIEVPPEEFREQQIENALLHIKDIMERLNYNDRRSVAVLNSLVYPDIWLIHRGQQTVEQGLANIQSRLELYVDE